VEVIGGDGDEGEELIELEDGETVPVVDEDGNQLGLLQRCGPSAARAAARGKEGARSA
jgi:hypothetical protein